MTRYSTIDWIRANNLGVIIQSSLDIVQRWRVAMPFYVNILWALSYVNLCYVWIIKFVLRPTLSCLKCAWFCNRHGYALTMDHKNILNLDYFVQTVISFFVIVYKCATIAVSTLKCFGDSWPGNTFWFAPYSISYHTTTITFSYFFSAFNYLFNTLSSWTTMRIQTRFTSCIHSLVSFIHS